MSKPGFHLTITDLQFLKSLGVKSGSPEIAVAKPDGTVRLLHKFGIPVTRENYLRLAFGGTHRRNH